MMSQPKAKKRFLWRRAIIVAIACFLLIQLGQQYKLRQAMLAEVEVHRQLLADATEEYRSKRELLWLYYSDSFLEQIARSSLGMVKIGEVVVSPAEVSDVLELNQAIRVNDVLH